MNVKCERGCVVGAQPGMNEDAAEAARLILAGSARRQVSAVQQTDRQSFMDRGEGKGDKSFSRYRIRLLKHID